MKNPIMETINHEYYVSLEVAKLLKEAGFDWECPDKYERSIITCRYEDYEKPTLEVAQRWLREVKDIDVYIFPTTNNKRECVYELGIKTFGRSLWVRVQQSTAQYDTYEEAQETGIKKALEIILEEEK